MKEFIQKHKTEIISEFNNQKISSAEIITKVVDVTTIRAYWGNIKYQPLSMYRVWAQENLITDPVKKEMLFNATDFETIHQYFSDNLQQFWTTKDGSSLDKIYKVYKIVDLFFKGVALWDELPTERRHFFLNNVHSPLDQFSLKFLKLTSESLKNEIPENVSMNFIQNDKGKYVRYQSEIMRISKEHGITPYIFDEIAWQFGHSESKKDELYTLLDLKKSKLLKSTT